MPLRGFMPPRTPEGRSSILPPPPWHYSGDLLIVEYRTHRDRIAALLPEGVTPADEDGDVVAIQFADWQWCSAGGEELLDPSRSQYNECTVIARCRHQGRDFSTWCYVWVDDAMSLMRGVHQGFPKRYGVVRQTRPVRAGRAGPRLEAGGRFGATVTTNGRRLVEAKVTLEAPSEHAGIVTRVPPVQNRYLPSIVKGQPASLDELVLTAPSEVDPGPTWRGKAELQIFSSPYEELDRLEPLEILGGWWRAMGVTFDGGVKLGSG